MNDHMSYGTDLSKKPKHDENLLKNVVFFYACLIISLTLSLSVNSITSDSKNSTIADSGKTILNKTGVVLDVYLTILHVFASAILIALFIYLHINRNQTFEEAKKENSKSSEIHYSMCGEKVGLYLRFGVVLIGSLSLIHIGLSSARTKSYDKLCFNPSGILSSLTEIIFFIIQTVFILRYHSVVILKNTKIIKFGLYTVVFINIAIWEIASIMKIKFSSSSSTKANHPCVDYVLDKIHLYFLPAVSEYCVICMAIMYEIMKRLGKLSLIETSHDNKSEEKFWRSRKSFAGVIIGIVIVLIYVTLTTLVILLDKKGESNSSTVFIIHNTEEISMYLFTMVILILALSKTKKLKFSFAFLLNNVDKNLLFVSCFLSITFSVLLSTFCFQYSMDYPHFLIRAISALVEVFQIILQTYFIQDAFYRCTENKDQQRSKPGQCYLAILIGCNFGMWLFKSFQLKNGDPFFHRGSNAANLETQTLLSFFVYLTLPLSILYRYHSSACLADVFSKIYQGEVCRFEGLLRAEGFDKCAMVVQDDVKPSTPQIVIQGASPKVSRPRAITLPEIPAYIPPQRSNLSKKMARRETIKNFEAAKLRVLSSQFSHNLVSKKLSATVAPNQNSSTGSINEMGNERSPTLSSKGKNHHSHSDTEMPTVKQLFMTNMFNSSLRRRNSEDEQSTVTSRSVKFSTNPISEHNED